MKINVSLTKTEADELWILLKHNEVSDMATPKEVRAIVSMTKKLQQALRPTTNCGGIK